VRPRNGTPGQANRRSGAGVAGVHTAHTHAHAHAEHQNLPCSRMPSEAVADSLGAPSTPLPLVFLRAQLHTHSCGTCSRGAPSPRRHSRPLPNMRSRSYLNAHQHASPARPCLAWCLFLRKRVSERSRVSRSRVSSTHICLIYTELLGGYRWEEVEAIILLRHL
jgi:hypothetical protein